MSLEIPGEAEEDGMEDAGSNESMGWKKIGEIKNVQKEKKS